LGVDVVYSCLATTTQRHDEGAEMRKLMALVVLICGAASTDAAEPQNWCSVEGIVITQTETGTYLLDGKPVEVAREDGNGEEDFLLIVYDDKIFAPCGAPSADAAECDEFFPCP
jgi:hypothetical protein